MSEEDYKKIYQKLWGSEGFMCNSCNKIVDCLTPYANEPVNSVNEDMLKDWAPGLDCEVCLRLEIIRDKVVADYFSGPSNKYFVVNKEVWK